MIIQFYCDFLYRKILTLKTLFYLQTDSQYLQSIRNPRTIQDEYLQKYKSLDLNNNNHSTNQSNQSSLNMTRFSHTFINFNKQPYQNKDQNINTRYKEKSYNNKSTNQNDQSKDESIKHMKISLNNQSNTIFIKEEDQQQSNEKQVLSQVISNLCKIKSNSQRSRMSKQYIDRYRTSHYVDSSPQQNQIDAFYLKLREREKEKEVNGPIRFKTQILPKIYYVSIIRLTAAWKEQSLDSSIYTDKAVQEKALPKTKPQNPYEDEPNICITTQIKPIRKVNTSIEQTLRKSSSKEYQKSSSQFRQSVDTFNRVQSSLNKSIQQPINPAEQAQHFKHSIFPDMHLPKAHWRGAQHLLTQQHKNSKNIKNSNGSMYLTSSECDERLTKLRTSFGNISTLKSQKIGQNGTASSFNQALQTQSQMRMIDSKTGEYQTISVPRAVELLRDPRLKPLKRKDKHPNDTSSSSDFEDNSILDMVDIENEQDLVDQDQANTQTFQKESKDLKENHIDSQQRLADITKEVLLASNFIRKKRVDLNRELFDRYQVIRSNQKSQLNKSVL